MGGRFKSPPTWLLRTVLPQWAPFRWHVGRTDDDGEGDEEEELDAAHEGRGGEDTSLPKSQADTARTLCLFVCLFVCTTAASIPVPSVGTDRYKQTHQYILFPS